jgi:hypothetical protein
VAAVPRLATRCAGRRPTIRGRIGAGSRADLGFDAKWRATGCDTVSRPAPHGCCPQVRRAGKVRAHPMWWLERSGGAAGGERLQRKRVRAPVFACEVAPP